MQVYFVRKQRLVVFVTLAAIFMSALLVSMAVLHQKASAHLERLTHITKDRDINSVPIWKDDASTPEYGDEDSDEEDNADEESDNYDISDDQTDDQDHAEYGDPDDADEDEEENDNPFFKNGDFDQLPPTNQTFLENLTSTNIEATIVSVGKWEPRKLQAERISILPLKNNCNKTKLTTTFVEDKVFWSKSIEDSTPKGLTDAEAFTYAEKVRRLQVIGMSPSSWRKCGRPKNQYVLMSDGSSMCARYRSPHNYLVLGEVMSFYLARLLGIHNVPVVVLSKVKSTDSQWDKLPIANAGWLPNTTVALIQWIHDLERDRMPEMISEALTRKYAISQNLTSLQDLHLCKLVELLQWSDMIVFDYITGNYDRVASMQDAADKEHQPSILNETVHNLVKSRQTAGIWLIDNESGLLDAYSLLRGSQGERFVNFHWMMLKTMCIFRRTLAMQVAQLSQQSNPHRTLLDFIHQHEPLFMQFLNPKSVPAFAELFKNRVNDVHNWIMRCQRG